MSIRGEPAIVKSSAAPATSRRGRSDFTLPVDPAGSQGHAGTAATAQAGFDIRKNGGSIGTATFAASATTATFVFASATSFAAGDRLEVTAPASPDATLADVAITLTGTRS